MVCGIDGQPVPKHIVGRSVRTSPERGVVAGVAMQENVMARTRTARKTRFARAATRTARAERAIQRKIDAKDRARGKRAKDSRPPQTGARRYPTPPMPKQHQRKP